MEPDQALAAAVVAETMNCLNSCVTKIKHCLGQLTDEQVWCRPQESMNSIGNLVLHLSGNVRQWILAGIGGAPDVRDQPQEFSEREVIPKVELLGRLDEVISAAIAVLAKMTPDDLLRVRRMRGYEKGTPSVARTAKRSPPLVGERTDDPDGPERNPGSWLCLRCDSRPGTETVRL